ncbi:hypothetical protein VP01_3190g2 [Puccinia sorghi]|uniref:Uncharacterized protein n=1 Tax=Puccinia sorghi TaxID=27349 RepID=A0A0L6UYH3_9BASI|nr:hypothetical protein VP01_3190g2 [Puccinia sorghi]
MASCCLCSSKQGSSKWYTSFDQGCSLQPCPKACYLPEESRNCTCLQMSDTLRMCDSFQPSFWCSQTASCGRDLLQTFSRSYRGLPASQHFENQNTERFSILPAISMARILAMAVTQDTFNGRQWEDFLRADLVIKNVKKFFLSVTCGTCSMMSFVLTCPIKLFAIVVIVCLLFFLFDFDMKCSTLVLFACMRITVELAVELHLLMRLHTKQTQEIEAVKEDKLHLCYERTDWSRLQDLKIL